MSSVAPAPMPHPFAEAIRKAIGEVFIENFGSDWSVEISREPSTTEDVASVWFGFSIAGDIGGEAALQLSLHDAGLLAKKFVADADGAATDFSVADKQAVQEIFQQVLNAAVLSLKEQFGEITAQVTATGTPTWPGLTLVLNISGALWGASSVQLRLGSDLVDAMAPKPELAVAVPDPVPAAATVTTAKSVLENDLHQQEEHLPISGDTTDLLWDLDSEEDAVSISAKDLALVRKAELKLTIRFGTRTLTLKDVLGLSSGSVIELDREVQGPAELLLGQRVVGRGEVVIVDGNYGVRVTEVAETRQRRRLVAGI